MEAIGNLAGGVAHDFNNLLTVIIGYSDMLVTRYKEDTFFQKSIAEIKKTGIRASELTKQLLAMSRKQVLSRKILDLNSLISNMLKMLNRLISEDIKIKTEFDKSLLNIEADPTTIEQVILNLVVNSKDAMPSGGEINIKTENVKISKNFIRTNPEARVGDFILLSVTDSGFGIPEEAIKNIFDPFFTTKDKGKGTGLGLSVVYGIIKQQEGWINVKSELQKGTIFEIFFPAVSQKINSQTNEVNPKANLYGKNETILLIEDETSILNLLKQVLIGYNYNVYPSKNIKEAKDFFNDNKKTIDLVLSDVILPDGNGIDFVEEVLKEIPQLKVILNSGYTDSKSKSQLISEKGYNFLQKPYDVDELLKLIKSLL